VKTTFGTWTSEGFVRHLRHPAGFDMPVRLEVQNERVGDVKELQRPARGSAGGYVFVSPGGFNYPPFAAEQQDL